MARVFIKQVGHDHVSRQEPSKATASLFNGPWNQEFSVFHDSQAGSAVARQKLTVNEKQLLEEMKADIQKKNRSEVLRVCRVQSFKARKIDKLCSSFFEVE